MWDDTMFQKRMQFLRDRAKTGQFIEQYGDEGYYEGEFLYGMRHGQGKHFFRSQVYEGEWKWDMRHGESRLYKAKAFTIQCESTKHMRPVLHMTVANSWLKHQRKNTK